MVYTFSFYAYHRPFSIPLATSHGVWKEREGIILRLTDRDENVGWGEIAPLSWFGSETLSQAWLFCQSLGSQITLEEIKEIPDSLSACQFGFESAWEELEKLSIEESRDPGKKLKLSYLLPAGKEALRQWNQGWRKGYETFKWKIGVYSLEEEIQVFEQLIEELPRGIKLRLDGNGGLNVQEAQTWLKIADQLGIIEFIEQPLPPQKLDSMIQLSQDYKTPLALDESVSNLTQLEICYQKGWQGIFVIKAAIAGFPSRLRQLCQTYPIDAVFSSVFETKIGRRSVLRLAEELMSSDRAVGFGVDDWFEDTDNEGLDTLLGQEKNEEFYDYWLRF